MIFCTCVLEHPASASKETLQSLCDTKDVQSWTLVAVDNATQAVESTWTEAMPHPPTILRNFRELGFARAQNQAIASIMARVPAQERDHALVVILFHNPIVAPGMLKALEGQFTQYPDLMLATPLIREVSVQVSEDVETPVLEDTQRVIEAGARRTSWGALEACVPAEPVMQSCAYVGKYVIVTRLRALERLGGEQGPWLDERLDAQTAIDDVRYLLAKHIGEAVVIPSALAWIREDASKRKNAFIQWLDIGANTPGRALLRSRYATAGEMLRAIPRIIAEWLAFWLGIPRHTAKRVKMLSYLFPWPKKRSVA